RNVGFELVEPHRGAAPVERALERLEDVDDGSPLPAARARRRGRAEPGDEVLGLEPERLRARKAWRDDVAEPDLHVLAEVLRVRDDRIALVDRELPLVL